MERRWFYAMWRPATLHTHRNTHARTHTHTHTYTRTQDKILKHLVVNTHLIPECPFCLDSSIYSVVERDVPLRKHPYDYNHSFSLQMSEMRPFFQLQRDGKYTITSNTCICIQSFFDFSLSFFYTIAQKFKNQPLLIIKPFQDFFF